MFIHRVDAGQQRTEVLRPDRDHGGQPDGGQHRVTPADPVPETEHVGRIDAEVADLAGIGRDGDEMPGDSLFVAQGGQAPTAG